MALLAGGLSRGLGSHPAAPGRDAVVFVWLLLSTWCTAPARAIQVTVSNPYHVVILFQPVTLPCTYQMTSTPTQPIVIWKYKSFCRDRIADAFSPASVDNQLNAQLAAGNPGYNPYVECQDSVRTIRVVATKQGNAVTLGDYYQGRRITITGNADLTFDQTAWGDSGVYYCSVVSAQDLQGNNEAYAELIVLDWLFVVVVCLAAFLIFLLLGICWCQCCPHTCCCYVRCPCCPDKCCCPEALYAAGKAATSGVPSIYAPSTYAHLSPAKTPPPPAMIPMGPAYNGYPGGYPGDVDRSSSGEAGGSRNSWWGCAGHLDTEGQGLEGRGSWEPRRGSAPGAQPLTATLPQLVAKAPTYPCFGTRTAVWPLVRIHHPEVGCTCKGEGWARIHPPKPTTTTLSLEVRSGYRIQASQQDDSMRVLYYMEKELANFDPSRPGAPNGRVERAMSEVTSLHEDDWRSRPSRGPALTPIRDEEWGGHSPRSPRGWDQEPPREQAGGGWRARRPRARSVDALDDLTPPSTAESGSRSPTSSGRRGRAYMPPRSRSRDDLYDQDDSRDFPRSRDPHYDDFRSRERPPADPRSHHHRTRDPRDNGSRSGDFPYDGRLLEEAVRKKGSEERKRPYKEEEEEAYYPPAPPPYSETDSQASRERRLKKSLALSRESLVV
ncbi:lipolysis-stimulated lipoprotein receptor isoform X2 [Nomascus leucogenys]|uniref:lipolysis-stimulated lipoprotein receptor isoform X2 n=1 Tax=Nomascus leucogenys TaxID=61853 RepID=UPI00122DBC92|nr:lipolysis-stimulated lipoprotein receptor isoform X2 [Nomascus leucogenys]